VLKTKLRVRIQTLMSQMTLKISALVVVDLNLSLFTGQEKMLLKLRMMRISKLNKKRIVISMMQMLWKLIWKNNNRINYHFRSKKCRHMIIVKAKVMMKTLSQCQKVKLLLLQVCFKVPKKIQIRQKLTQLITKLKHSITNHNKFQSTKV